MKQVSFICPSCNKIKDGNKGEIMQCDCGRIMLECEGKYPNLKAKKEDMPEFFKDTLNKF